MRVLLVVSLCSEFRIMVCFDIVLMGRDNWYSIVRFNDLYIKFKDILEVIKNSIVFVLSIEVKEYLNFEIIFFFIKYYKIIGR